MKQREMVATIFDLQKRNSEYLKVIFPRTVWFIQYRAFIVGMVVGMLIMSIMFRLMTGGN